jgi:ApaG protein
MNKINNIQITVQCQHLPVQALQEDKYAFAYHVSIINNSPQSVQLINRYWLITDGNGKKTEVHGAGVIGQQPYLQIGQEFCYSSGAILDTPVGTMQGYYELQSADGNWFEAPIAVFSLAVAHLVN